MAGEDVFARGGPLDDLRAVGGLFPEAIHVVVLASSPIRDIAQLRGRRVDIGAPSSGTRFDAVAVLAAYGLKPADLGEARERRPEGRDRPPAAQAARRRLRDRRGADPAAAAARDHQGLRLLPVRGAALERLATARPGLTPLTLPANTYPGQKHAVATVASAALLVTTLDAPDAEVNG